MQRICVRFALAILAVFPFAVARASSLQDSTPASVTGIISDSSGRPLVKAHIFASDSERQALTDLVGHFTLANLRPGANSFSIRAIGYSPVDFSLLLNPGESRYVNIELRNVVARLTAVVVNEKPTQRILRELGFYDRAGSVRGTFLTPETLATRQGARTSDVLRGVNGVRIERSNAGALPFGSGGYVSIGTNGVCLMNLYIDGSRVEIGSASDRFGPMPSYELAKAAQAASVSLDDVISGNDIGAIEVYPSGVTTPQKYSGVSRGCGTILIWTKMKLDIRSGQNDSTSKP